MSVQSWPPSPGGVLDLAPVSAATLAFAGVKHGFFGRRGGVSEGIYAGLNAGPGSNDNPAAVVENRRRIAAWFGVEADHLLSAHQVHSGLALVVDGPWSGPRPQVDGLVTARPGLVLSVLTADCAPILMADARAGVIGAAHAGWKGAFGGVIEATLAAMEGLGARRDRICAGVGPTIAQANYEVGPEFRARFVDANQDYADFFVSGVGDRFLFDLPAFCVTRLQQAGVNRMTNVGLDTFSSPEHSFSHRRSVRDSLPDYGRNCAAIMLLEP